MSIVNDVPSSPDPLGYGVHYLGVIVPSADGRTVDLAKNVSHLYAVSDQIVNAINIS